MSDMQAFVSIDEARERIRTASVFTNGVAHIRVQLGDRDAILESEARVEILEAQAGIEQEIIAKLEESEARLREDLVAAIYVLTRDAPYTFEELPKYLPLKDSYQFSAGWREMAAREYVRAALLPVGEV